MSTLSAEFKFEIGDLVTHKLRTAAGGISTPLIIVWRGMRDCGSGVYKFYDVRMCDTEHPEWAVDGSVKCSTKILGVPLTTEDLGRFLEVELEAYVQADGEFPSPAESA